MQGVAHRLEPFPSAVVRHGRGVGREGELAAAARHRDSCVLRVARCEIERAEGPHKWDMAAIKYS